MYNGVFCVNSIPYRVLKPCALVVNTEPAPITGHWIAIFINQFGEGFYFNSYGLSPTPILLEFLDRNTNSFVFSKKRLQKQLTKTCGYYATLFLISMAEGSSYQCFLNQFSPTDYAENDLKITQVINALHKTAYETI